MKLKQECVRYVLLSLEEQGFEMTQQGAQLPDIQSALANDHFSNDDISYTLLQLMDGKYINARELLVCNITVAQNFQIMG